MKDLRDALYDTDALKKKRYIMQQMLTERTQHEASWKLISKYIYPWRGRFDDEGNRRSGERKDECLLDPYPIGAIKKCAAGLSSGLTSPSRPWFKLSLQDEEKAAWHPVRLWLDAVEDILMKMYSKSNTYRMLQEHEFEMPQFGTSACLMAQDMTYGIANQWFTCGEYAGANDARGHVVKFCRKMHMTAEQMVLEFGEDQVSDSVRQAFRNDNLTDRFWVNMLIEKNADYEPHKLAMGNFPWKSWYWEDGRKDKFLRVSGYHEQPFLMPRWETVGNDVYGVGLGHANLGNCMQLQKLERNKLRGIDADSDPAMLYPSTYKNINSAPGAKNFVEDTGSLRAMPLIPPGAKRYEGIMAEVQNKREQIASGFYNDLMIMLSGQPDNPQMTAREVAERHEEKLLMLGPVLEQFHTEVLEPLTMRAFGIGMRNNLFPPMPDELDGSELEVNFISLLAQAERLVDAPGINNTVGMAGNMAAFAPEVIDNLDTDEIVRQIADIYGAPAKILRDKEEVEKLRQQRQQAQMQQEQAAQMQQMAQVTPALAQAGKTMSETTVNGQNALEQALSGAGVAGVGGM